MLGLISEVLQSAADVLAPPPTPIQDFEYHWSLVKNFYLSDRTMPRVHIDDTNIPSHLDCMLSILIKEADRMRQDEANAVSSECLDFLLNNRPLDILVDLAMMDSPPGARVCVLNWIRRLLCCLENPPLHHVSLLQPIQKLIPFCNGISASPYEKEEILFLATVAGLVRKQTGLIDLFLPAHNVSAGLVRSPPSSPSPPSGNSLFEDALSVETSVRRVSLIADSDEIDSTASPQPVAESISSQPLSCDCDRNERFRLLNVILGYFESPDSTVVVRACEAALILSSLDSFTLSHNCVAIVNSFEAFASLLADKLAHLCHQVPDDMDPIDIEEAIVSWGLNPRDIDAEHFVGRRQLHEFLCWLDYADCVARECPMLGNNLGNRLRESLLESVLETALVDVQAPHALVLTAKIVKQIESIILQREIGNWLVGCPDVMINSNDSLLTILIENALETPATLVATLKLIETLIDAPNDRILDAAIFRFVNTRGYCDPTAKMAECWSDEEEERVRRLGTADAAVRSRTLAPNNILKVINNFLLLIPKHLIGEGLAGTCYEEYVQDASRHYQSWIAKTNDFQWPVEAVHVEQQQPDEELVLPSPRASVSPSFNQLSQSRDECSSGTAFSTCNGSVSADDNFYEGPLLKMLFNHVRNMSVQPYELNLAVIAIISKLALMPHPYLHEILLNPEIPVAMGATTLWTAMQSLVRHLLTRIPCIEGFRERVILTEQRLLSEQPGPEAAGDEEDPLFESLVVLKEFCKELAAIAFVKYHHATEAEK